MPSYYIADNGQAKTTTALITAAALVESSKPRKDPLVICGGNTRTVIRDRQQDA